jgi:hypothetical protein
MIGDAGLNDLPQRAAISLGENGWRSKRENDATDDGDS